LLKGIKYTEISVSNDRDKAREMIEKSGQMGVPVILIDDQVVVGFNQPMLDKLLGISEPSRAPPAQY